MEEIEGKLITALNDGMGCAGVSCFIRSGWRWRGCAGGRGIDRVILLWMRRPPFSFAVPVNPLAREFLSLCSALTLTSA